MLGAIIGDVVGSRFEFNNIKTKKFKLFTDSSYFTDDTVMTIAVDEIMANGWQNDKEKIVETIKKWGKAYPYAGYGSHFLKWVLGEDKEPYYSCGNGSAMRISAVGWYAQTEDEVKDFSRKVTEITHNHPEGLKGAEVVAMCIYYARKKKSKTFIKEYVEKNYNIDFNYKDLIKNFKHEEETCQATVPQALWCFLNSNSFEDCLRTTISIGGDCDTTAAISCAIAEAYYGLDKKIIQEVLSYLTEPMKKVLNKIYMR